MNLELRDISLRFSHKTVLQELSLSFEEGQLHALLGENGAGKSTLANIICGELQPDSGDIFVDGQAQVFKAPKDAIAKGICYVHQRPMLADSISVKENLLLGLKKEEKERLFPQAEKWLGQIDLNAPVSTYGADIRFFIALTSALIKAPKLLILDEPSALLDQKQRDFLFLNLKSLAANGLNLIIITHYYEEAEKYCDTIDFLENGRRVSAKKITDYKQSIKERVQASKATQGLPCISFTDPDFTVQKGRITLIRGLAEDGLMDLENKLIQMRARHKFSQKTALIPTDKRFTGSSPKLTIEEMLTAALQVPENQKARLAQEMIEKSGIIITAGEKCANLSGGMLQKLLFQRELYASPDFLILCNPMQGLDVQTCDSIYNKIRNAADSGAYVLILSYGALPSSE